MLKKKQLLFVALVSLCSTLFAESVSAARCLFVSSYHQGYAWSDGIERGLRSVLDGRCELKQFDMDTKRHKSIENKQQAAESARRIIEAWRPDIVITADDNAAKYLIVEHYRGNKLPFVFSGVNWSAEEYGFPYSNVTGIVEVAPILPMLKAAIDTAGSGRAFYLGADTLTERKNLARFVAAAANLGLGLDSRLVSSADDWIKAHADAQRTQAFLILGSFSGIDDWEEKKNQVVEAVKSSAVRLSVTNHDWMMPFAILGLTKVPEEQGIWSGQAALAILEGARPADIPIIANRRWDVWVNESLLTVSRLELPGTLLRKAKKMP
ncbi:MAG: ABC-type uncharacterized transport system substrate-binding protein [Gammaproteobacteria bacterium]|jgi:ABC-type uncharacterized transport system substrate-binding protein